MYSQFPTIFSVTVVLGGCHDLAPAAFVSLKWFLHQILIPDFRWVKSIVVDIKAFRLLFLTEPLFVAKHLLLEFGEVKSSVKDVDNIDVLLLISFELILHI